jgi:ABC-type nitrate/sulfonate/bicarbonate transport system substrate-binding protein
MRSLGRMIDLLGPYQAGGAFVLRRWAASHPEVLENYMKAYVTTLRWLSEPVNRAEALAILRAHLKLTPDVADVAFSQLTDAEFGFTPDARIDMRGIQNMLAIRAETEGAGGAPLDPNRFLDMTYYNRAIATL